jgi:hypothetical protein
MMDRREEEEYVCGATKDRKGQTLLFFCNKHIVEYKTHCKAQL